MNTSTPHEVLQARLHGLTIRTLSPASRYAHVGVLLLALIMSALVLALLLTEASLPGRTRVALGALLALGIGWCAYSTWVLTCRRTLLVNQQLVAGWMAVAGTAAFLLCSAVAVRITGSMMAVTALVAAATMACGALWILARSIRRVRELRALRRMLEQA